MKAPPPVPEPRAQILPFARQPDDRPQLVRRLRLARRELNPGPGARTPVHDQALLVIIDPTVVGHLIPVEPSDVGPVTGSLLPASHSPRQDLV